jgi:hypothetical protein
MLENLHVRFGVGAGVKLPRLHHRGRDLSADPGAKTEGGGDEVSTSHHLDFFECA